MYAWVPNPVFLSYKGQDIYYIYKNDYESDGVRTYWYGISEDASEVEDRDEFDVRDLPGYDYKLSIEDNIKKAIDDGVDLQELCDSYDEEYEEDFVE